MCILFRYHSVSLTGDQLSSCHVSVSHGTFPCCVMVHWLVVCWLRDTWMCQQTCEWTGSSSSSSLLRHALQLYCTDAWRMQDRHPTHTSFQMLHTRQVHSLAPPACLPAAVFHPYQSCMLLPCRVRIDTVSKARYGTLVKQLGGWSWLQDMLRVRQLHYSQIPGVGACAWL